MADALDPLAAATGTPTAGAPRSRIATWTAALVLLGLGFTAVSAFWADPEANDSANPLFVMFGIPAVVTSLVIQIAAHDSAIRNRRLGRAFLWWLLLVLPVGVLAGLGVMILRNRDYFIQEDSTGWDLVLPVVGVYCGILAGALLWFFFVFPIANLMGVLVRIARREVGLSMVVIPLAHLSLGALILLLPMSVDAHGTSLRGVVPSGIFAILGIPGNYEVTSELGLWIVRLILIALVLGFVVPAWRARRRTAGASSVSPPDSSE